MLHAVRSCAAILAVGLTACSAPPEPIGTPTTEPRQSPVEPSSTARQPAAWQQLADAPLARLEMATTAHDGRIWLAGGLSPLGEAVSEVEVFDPASGTWASGPPLPNGVHHAALVSDGEQLVLIGGYLGASLSEATDIVLTLSAPDGEWEAGPSLPEPRAAGAAAWDGRRIVYGGGVGPGGVSADVFVLEDRVWQRIGAMSQAREHLAAASDGEGRTWLLGGRVGSLESNLADVDLVEAATISELPALPTPRGGVAAFFAPALGACLTGGEAVDGAYTTVECVAPDGSVLTVPDMNVRRHGHGAAVVGGVAYVVLGGPTPGLSTHASIELLDTGR